MKKNMRYVLPILALSLSGCLMTRSDVEEAQTKRNVQDQVQHLQKNNADQNSRFNDINSDLRDMSGRVEVLENKMNTQDGEKQKSHVLLEQQLADTNKRVLALQEEIVKLESQVAALAALQGGPSSAHAGAASSDTAPSKGNSFDTAEEYFQKKDYQNAILWYAKYREKFPNGKKVPECLLNMATSFHALNMKDDAKTFYTELVQRFPHSAQAKIAKGRLAKLK